MVVQEVKACNKMQNMFAVKYVECPDRTLSTLCRCKGNCGNMCGCQKTGLKCSGACLNCSGETCSNTMNVMRLMDENDFEDEIPTMTPVQFPTFLDDAVSEA
ncbi:hypothetical protein PV328_008461 [Microctonus aethiopoides]|uniref:Tesmin/TSO1-like CXC domain-containing protein n=1 Tax=Microctonus aethiopoides TaxID=144406 RepID=A0AA39KR28_9HYME|nr:hypothetical protein PV328_008461 [Microctonus aethiopoides]